MSTNETVARLRDIKKAIKARKFDYWAVSFDIQRLIIEGSTNGRNAFYIRYMHCARFFQEAPILNQLGFINLEIKHVKEGYYGRS